MSAARPGLIGVIVIILAFSASGPSWAIEADGWGYGFYSASHQYGDVYSFDITLHLASLDFISTTLTPADDVVLNTIQFTGLHWQPDGGNLLNHFVDGTFNPISHSVLDNWAPGSGGIFGQTGTDGFVGISVDDDGTVPAPPAYDIHADSQAEWLLGIQLPQSAETIVRFKVDIEIPHGLGDQNALFGWTGKKSGWDPNVDGPNTYIQAQLSTTLTPELPTVGLMLPTLLGCAGFYWRRWRHRAK